MAEGGAIKRSSLSFILGLVASLALAIFAGRFWLKPFMIYGHSAFVDYLRQLCFDLAIRDGVWYPRWIDEFYYGYGSPIFNFYAPFFYLFSEIFRLFGVSILYSLNLARFTIFLVAGAGMYLLSRMYCSAFGAWAASLLFVFSNYFLANSYVRVASGELLALAISPYLLLMLVRFLRKPSISRMILFSLTFALLIVSHNISALLWAIAVMAFGLWSAIWARKLSFLRWTVLGFALALALSAFFWMPAFFERNMVHSEQSLTEGFFDYRKHFVYADQIWRDEWGYGISREGRKDTMSVSCGRALLLVWLAGMGAVFIMARSKADKSRESWFFALGSVASFFMLFPISKWLWGLFPLFKFIQFPWRFYLIFIPLSVAVVSIGLGHIQKQRKTLAGILVAAIALSVLISQSPRATGYRAMLRVDNLEAVRVDPTRSYEQTGLVEPQKFFTIDKIPSLGVTTTAKDDYLPVWVEKKPARISDSFLEVTGGARATILAQRHNYFKILVESSDSSQLALNVFYFPGWKAVRDGLINLVVKPEKVTGRLLVELEKGAYELDVYFGSDSLRTVGWTLSACALVFCVFTPILSLVRRKSAHAGK